MPLKWKYDDLFKFLAIEASSGTAEYVLSNNALKCIKFKRPFNDYLKNIFVNQTNASLSIFIFFNKRKTRIKIESLT